MKNKRSVGDIVEIRDTAKQFYETYQLDGPVTIDEILDVNGKKAFRLACGGALFLTPPGHVRSAKVNRTTRKPLAERLAETFQASPSELRGMLAAHEARKAARTRNSPENVV